MISGASLELGRLASGEKGPTRQEFDRSSLLRQEFEDFAASRLKLGGNCHRNDVVRAFRRFYGKYRQEESVEYPLTNLEIERLLREWNRSRGGVAEMSQMYSVNVELKDEQGILDPHMSPALWK